MSEHHSLPFLVTNWLSAYESEQGADTPEQRAARAQVRNAAALLASAFSTLGAFGTIARVRY
jgi:hypothetical protein